MCYRRRSDSVVFGGIIGGSRLENKTTTEGVPISEKYALSIKEAAQYTGIGQNVLYELIKIPKCPFVLQVGKKHLIKREKLEQYLNSKNFIDIEHKI